MLQENTYPDWIACDWGTSNLRVWAMRGNEVIAQACSDDGMGGLSPDQFEGKLLNLIGDWLPSGPTPVIACGMVGSRQGWAEAPYVAVPAKPHSTAVTVATEDRRIAMHILPGLKQNTPPDVMRGEETQIAGFLAENPDFDGVLCLPGTHSKWAHISAGEVVSFRTLMTGELFALLSKSSVLRHSVGTESGEGFADAVAETLSRPEVVAAKLFEIRAGDLLRGTPKTDCRSRLSGLLIGLELAATRPYWLGQNVALVGATSLTSIYAQALETQGVFAVQVNGPEITLNGLSAAYSELVA